MYGTVINMVTTHIIQLETTPLITS